MKLAVTIILFICTFPIGNVQDPSPTQIPRIGDPVKFDEWGDIPFRDEQARLDNAALNVQKLMPQNIIYLLIYAGQTACVGEAKARGIRAKKHLMQRGIPPAQVVWIDAGWRKELTTEVWIWSPEVGKPSPESFLKPSEVRLRKNCKISQPLKRKVRR